jgi:hypothetical protein
LKAAPLRARNCPLCCRVELTSLVPAVSGWLTSVTTEFQLFAAAAAGSDQNCQNTVLAVLLLAMVNPRDPARDKRPLAG